jgi:hypothetical protein
MLYWKTLHKYNSNCQLQKWTPKVLWGQGMAFADLGWLFTTTFRGGVSNVLEQRFLQGEQINNIQVHISRKWWAKLCESNIWNSPQSDAVPCSYPHSWIFVRSLSWVHGEAVVHVHYNYSCQCGSKELYKWSFCTYKDINKYQNAHNFTNMPIILPACL